MKHLFAITITLLLASAVAQAQDTTVATPRRAHHPSALGNNAEYSMHLLYDQPVTSRELIQGCRHLTLDIDATGFFYDAEYATSMAKGYTVAGFRLSPALAYGINERAQLRIGFNATAFAGLDSLYRLRPTLSLVYAPTRWLTLVAGTIYGSHTHRLDVPVYDPSRWIFNYQEDGLQILTKTKLWNSDTWLDWQHYLTPWTPDQERFTMGTRHQFRIINIQKRKTEWAGHDFCKDNELGWQISLPIHFIASHRGGELKTIDTNTVTTFNERIGLQIKHSFANALRPSFHNIRFDMSVYDYHLEDRDLDRPGQAFYSTLSYEWMHWNKQQMADWAVRAAVGFWHGNHYFSAFGDPRFWSHTAYASLHVPQSTINEGYSIYNLLTFTLSAEHEFKGLNLGLQFDACYNPDRSKNNTDFLFGFYMRFKERFLLF